jgi:hypothetical protein
MLKHHFKGPILTYRDVDIASTPCKEEYPEANALFLYREGKYNVHTISVEYYPFAFDIPWSTFSEHIVLKILSEGGKRYANIKIPFWKDWELLDLKARTIKPNGQIIELDKENVYEVSYFPEYILYSDRYAITFAFPAVDTGCVLEYVYTLGYHEPYVPRWFFQSTEPTVEAQFSYEVPKFIGFDHVSYSMPGVHIEKEVLSTKTHHKMKFTVHDVAAIKYEPLSPPIVCITSWVMMSWASMYFLLERVSSGTETWYEVGKNYHMMVDSVLRPSMAIQQRTMDIVDGCESDQEKIRRICDYVQDNYRYVAVEVEGHRISPNAPEKILVYQYGDCKDLVGLSISMLHVCGIDAYPVLVRTKTAGAFIEEFPSFEQFNHVVIAVPVKYMNDTVSVRDGIAHGEFEFTNSDDYVIFDPTASTIPFGKLHAEIQDRKGVLCAGLDSKLISIPSAGYTSNKCQTALTFVFDEHEYSGALSLNITGEEASRLRFYLKHSSRSEVENYILGYLSELPMKVVLDTFEVCNLDSKDSTLYIMMEFSMFSPLQTTKQQILIPIMFRIFSELKEIYACKERVYDVDFGFPQLNSDIIKIVIPPTYRINSLPEDERFQNDWCEYSFSTYISGDTAIVNRHTAIKESIIPQENFQDVKDFCVKVLNSSHKVIVFDKKY